MPGALAPDFALAATVSGCQVGLGFGRRPLALVVHARNADFAVDRLDREVRKWRPSPAGLTAASVVDLSHVPPLFGPRFGRRSKSRALVGGGLSSTQGGPAYYVVIPSNRTARITHDYGARGADLIPVVVGDGTMLGHPVGGGPYGGDARAAGADLTARVRVEER